MTDSQQRRHFTRIPFDAKYRLQRPDISSQWTGEVADLSLHGALIKRPENFDGQTGDKFVLELILGEEDVTIHMETHIAHIHDDLIGLECEHIELEGMTHLRRILELNLGDPELMEREIPEMIAVNRH
jgi:hypothetical protein